MLKLGILDVEGTKYTLKIGQEYLVGRKSNELSHDIEIDDQSVDIKHSIIDLTENASPQLFDVFSKHGTFVDDIKIPRFKSIPLAKTSKIRFGNVDTYLQLLFEGDSGFLEERLNSPTEDTSEIICDSPEHIASSGSRLKNSLKNSLTSTPNQSTATSLPSASKSDHNFAIPSGLPRISIGSNASARSVDSFYIPETQHIPDDAVRSRTNNSTDISLYSNTSKKNNTTGGDDDFFIPETQDVVVNSAAIPLSNHARLAFPSDDVNETLSQENRIPSSQFRICTQDFNGSAEDLSNQSDDILANVPLSMVIPEIKHDIVKINDFVKIDEEDDIDNEMSALQWSKKTLEENLDGSETPDGLFDVVGSVTLDISKVNRKSAEKTFSQCSTPDIFGIIEEPEIVTKAKACEVNKEQINVTKENKDHETANINDKLKKVPEQVNLENVDFSEEETELPPTQAFFKPIPINKSITRRSLPPPPQPEDDCDLLPETQVFSVSTINSKPAVPPTSTKPQIIPVSGQEESNCSKNSGKCHVFALPKASPKARPSPKPQASPKSQASPKPQESPKPQSTSSGVTDDEDDLPPTQVFLKNEHPPQQIITNVFSSTLVDCGMQLSENSFKTKFNKLLDSDDDEMDEIIAPDLVRKMRQSLDKPVQQEFTEVPVTPQKQQTPVKPSKQEGKTPSDKKTPTVTPDNNNFQIPAKASKTKLTKTPAVSIDHFMLTPDFLGNAFSKDSQLQKEAEVNWRNIVLEKRNKALFGDKSDKNENAINIDSEDESQDSFIDLLPKRRELRSKSVNKTRSETVVKSKVEDEVGCVRVTRRRSTFKANVATKEKVDKKEPINRGKKKNETKTTSTDVKDQKAEVAEERKNSKNDKASKSEKVSKQEKRRKKEKEHDAESEKDKKIENNSKTAKKSKISNDTKNDPIPGENSSLVKNGSLTKNSSNVNSELVKDSSAIKEDKLTNKSSSKNESRSSSAIREDKLSNKSSSKNESSSITRSSSAIREDKLSKKSSSKNESSSITRSSSAIKESSEIKSRPITTESSSPSLTNVVKTSKKHSDKTESGRGRPRTRKKIEEPITKVEEKPSRSGRAVKRNAEVTKSSKASKINKLDGLDVGSKQNDDKPSPRITRLRSATEIKIDNKKVILNNNRQKVKEDIKKEEPARKTPPTKTMPVESIDLTDSDREGKSSKTKKTAKKRKSQDDYVYKGSGKSLMGASQSSAESNDSDRTLRKKKKLKIAMTSCSPATREALVRYSGRVWDYTEDPKECDVLILEAGNRTYKLLVAIARGVPVVKIDWLKEVIMMRSTDISFEKYIFDEANFQKRHKFVMRDSLELAKSSSLFVGMIFMMTPNITPKPDEMKDIICCAGGTVLEEIPSSDDDRKFYLVSENVDNQLWYRYRRASPDVKVVTAISLMASVMQQSLEPLMKSMH